jgi:hypothetical protein
MALGWGENMTRFFKQPNNQYTDKYYDADYKGCFYNCMSLRIETADFSIIFIAHSEKEACNCLKKL